MGTTPIFICTGFLDSGKTTLIKDTLMTQDWIEPGLTLLIVCEEGEKEFSPEFEDEEYGNAAGRRGRAAESYIFQKLFEELPADTGCD